MAGPSMGALCLKNLLANKFQDMVQQYNDTTKRLYKDLKKQEEEEDVDENEGDDNLDMDGMLEKENAEEMSENEALGSSGDEEETNQTLDT